MTFLPTGYHQSTLLLRSNDCLKRLFNSNLVCLNHLLPATTFADCQEGHNGWPRRAPRRSSHSHSPCSAALPLCRHRLGSEHVVLCMLISMFLQWPGLIMFSWCIERRKTVIAMRWKRGQIAKLTLPLGPALLGWKHPWEHWTWRINEWIDGWNTKM